MLGLAVGEDQGVREEVGEGVGDHGEVVLGDVRCWGQQWSCARQKWLYGKTYRLIFRFSIFSTDCDLYRCWCRLFNRGQQV